MVMLEREAHLDGDDGGGDDDVIAIFSLITFVGYSFLKVT